MKGTRIFEFPAVIRIGYHHNTIQKHHNLRQIALYDGKHYKNANNIIAFVASTTATCTDYCAMHSDAGGRTVYVISSRQVNYVRPAFIHVLVFIPYLQPGEKSTYRT